MTTRRHALRTIAGATVVGSLGGCVQLATQRTTHVHGTPAMVNESVSGGTLNDLQPFGAAVGVEAHRTVERVGITKEIVAHSWGMLYSFVSINNTGNSSQQTVATFTTPSIQVAGQELNPIKDLTVGDVGSKFLSIIQTSTGPNEDSTIRSSTPQPLEGSPLRTATVADATGKKVLRAFRDSVGGGRPVEGNIEYTDSWTAERTIPDWNGDTYDAELTWATGEGDAGSYTASIRFDEHDGDYVVVFGTTTDPSTNLSDPNTLTKNITSFVNVGAPGGSPIVHPPDDEFSQEMLQRHLIGTNLRGTQGLVERARKLVGETRDLLKMGEYERDTLIQAVSELQNTIEEIQGTLQDCDSDACQTVVDHSEDRSSLAQDANRALENGNPGDARQSLEEMRDIIEEDIGILEGQDGEVAERALSLERTLLEDTGEANLSAAQWQTLLRTQQSLDQIDQLLGGVGEDLSSLSTDTIVGGTGNDTLQRIVEQSKKAAEIAAGAHERVASYNDTRDEEDDRFVAIERNLGRIGDLSAAAQSHMEKVSILYGK